MIQVDLLKNGKKKKNKRGSAILLPPRMFFLFLPVVIFIAIVASAYVYLLKNINTKEDEVMSLSKRKANIEQLITQSNETLRKRDVVTKQLSTFVKNIEKQESVSAIITTQKILSLVPLQKMWIEKIHCSAKEITITGFVGNDDRQFIISFMRGIKAQTPQIKDVGLAYTKQKENSGIKLQEFLIRCSREGDR
ncbi:MAG: PilN domain-containing protein [Deltaproteobacteria bacterium]